MNFWKLFALLLLTPIILMIMVNETSPAPSSQLDQSACTRYCHNHGCPHGTLSGWQAKVYAANINWLKANPFGLSYQQMNLLLYVILFPLMIVFALWSLIRKRRKHA